jgi:hypothetical protein
MVLWKSKHVAAIFFLLNIFCIIKLCFLFWRNSSPPSQWAKASSDTRFLDHTQPRTTVGRTTLDEWSARRRDLYLTTQNTHTQQTDIHDPGGIRTHNLSRGATSDLRLRPRGHNKVALDEKVIYWIKCCSMMRWKDFHIENPTRCHSVSKFYFILMWSSTCFGRHTAHHQEPKTPLAASGFAFVEGCWTCSWWTLSGTVCGRLLDV